MTDTFETDARGVYEDALALLLKKHSDYGASNISAAPGGPLNGLRVRMWDKTARINNLVDKGVEPENESLRDSFVDMLNYSAIALLVLDGKWPGTEKQPETFEGFWDKVAKEMETAWPGDVHLAPTPSGINVTYYNNGES